jgi:hypothetical protein
MGVARVVAAKSQKSPSLQLYGISPLAARIRPNRVQRSTTMMGGRGASP